jgi:hypothetical protein
MYSRATLSAHTKFCPNLTTFSWVKSTFQERGKSYILHGPLEGSNTNYVPVGEYTSKNVLILIRSKQKVMGVFRMTQLAYCI